MKIIILHGWGHNGLLWKNLADKLGKDAIAIDLPGFGSEPLIKNDWGVPEYASWVEKRIEKEKQVILIGHSFGGRVAAEIASHNPKWLIGIVLSGAPCVYRPTFQTIAKIKFYKSVKNFLPGFIKASFYTKDLKESQSKNLEIIFRKVVNYDQTKQLKNIKIPTLLIWGVNDDQVPLRVAHEMNTLIKNSVLKVIENSGHNSYLEKPDLFYGYVKNFIKNISIL